VSNSRLLIDVNNITLNVTQVDGIEQLNQGFEFILIGESSQQILLEHLLLQSALITFVNKDNFFRHLAGIIFECDNLGTFKDKYRYKIIIKDRLSTLKNITNSKVFIGVNLKDVIFYLAGQAGYSPGQIDFRVGSSLPALPQCVQAMETNWHFLQRILTQFGLFIWFETKNNIELLVISDSNLNSPYLQRGVVSVKNSAGMNNDENTAYVGFSNSQVHHSIYNDRTDCVAHGQYLKVASNSQSFFEPCASTPSAASLQAQDFSNALASLNKTTQLVGNVCDLFAGSSVAIDDQTGTGSSADLLCVSVYHSSEQPNDENSHQGLTRYSCKAQFIERGTPFKAKPLPHQAKPMVFPAKVESLTTSSFIDDLGCYRVRTDFDTTARPIAQSSQAIQQLALYACQNQPQATGWHFPLVGGSEVLIGCINNDPNNTFLMGFAMNESQPSVVTAANNTQNRLVSAAQNELQFDDDKQAPKIILQTLASEHYLELNAKKSGRQFIEWISQLGTINLHAGKDLCLTTENDNIQFVIKNNQFIDVKNNVSLSTQNRDINMQSAGSQAWQGKNTLIESRQALSMVSGRAVKAFAQSDIQLKTSSSDLTISAPNGSTFLQTNQSIAITGSGRGDLILHNEGGEIKLDSQGNVEVIATDVLTLDGTFINFDGPVDYDIESPSTASSSRLSKPKNITRIDNLSISDSGVASTATNTINLEYTYQDGSPVKNAPYIIEFVDGTERTGQLDSYGKAQLTHIPNSQFTVRYGEDSRDYHPEVTTTANPLYGKINPQKAVQMIEANETSLLQEANTMAAGAGNWVWGALQGDFNKNPSTSQIVVGSVISMIPVVDQLMDCRDVCANIMILSDEDDTNDADGWLALSLTAIGLVPVFGSALKGTLKVIIKNIGATLDAAFAVLRKLGKGDPEKFLKNLDWQSITKDATKAIKDLVNTIKEALNSILDSWLIRRMLDNQAINSIQASLNKLKHFENRIDSGIEQGISRIKSYVDEALSSNAKGRVVKGNTNQPVKAKTVELDATDIDLPYKIKEGVTAFKGSPYIFKRHHPHGQQSGDWPDSYTLMPNDRPLGATEGIMPKEFKGIKELDELHINKIEDGWPDIRYGNNYRNFTDLKPTTLPKGTKIYRVIDEGTSEATKQSSGAYWAFNLPSSKAQWRENYAVKDSWNDNGHYIEHILEKDEKVWVGGVAGQKYEEFEGSNFYLKGTETQIFITPGLITGNKIQPKLTNWPDAI